LPQIKTLVLPKVHSPEYLDRVRDIVEAESKEAVHLNLVASIESARGMWDIEKIAKWTSHSSGKASLKLQALLVCPVFSQASHAI
jgi:citrate lyase subunit beta-like protein